MSNLKSFVFIVALMVGSTVFAQDMSRVRGGGGDMPFPIGRVTDFPSSKIKGVWAAEDLKSKLFKLTPVPRSPNQIKVQMLNYYKEVVARGDGVVEEDQVLRATLNYVEVSNKVINVRIANYCLDQGFEIQEDKSICDESAMVVAFDEVEKNQKTQPSKFYILRKKRP
jgi:hypothetical protein